MKNYYQKPGYAISDGDRRSPYYKCSPTFAYIRLTQILCMYSENVNVFLIRPLDILLAVNFYGTCALERLLIGDRSLRACLSYLLFIQHFGVSVDLAVPISIRSLEQRKAVQSHGTCEDVSSSLYQLPRMAQY
jgi:hypothetical protein